MSKTIDQSELSSNNSKNSNITSTLVSNSINSNEQKSSDSSSSGSGSDSNDSDSDEEEDDQEVHKRMKDLLLKAKLSARIKSENNLIKQNQKEEGDGLTNQSELVLFGQEDDENEDEEEDVLNLNGASTSKSTSKPTFPTSLSRPLSVRTPTSSSISQLEGGRGLSFNSLLKGKGKEIVSSSTATTSSTGITLAQDLGNDIESINNSIGKGGKGDKWNRAPLPSLSKKQMKARHPPNAGPNWFGMTAPTITPELKREIQALRLRNALDPKRFYKGGAKDDKKLPEFFSFGHLLPSTSSASTASPGIPRKRTFVEELISDEQAKVYTKRKFGEVMASGMSGRARQKKGAKGKKMSRVR